jgi:soluble lytic murein transglycosylase
MSAHAQTRSAPRRRPRRRSRARVQRRRLAVMLMAALAGALIRQQAEDKSLDPSLIAGVIYVESRFRDQTSHAGAKGLMQLMPATADYIARKSGGTRFVQGDLADPQINISYGSWYLRYLLQHYHGNVALALAAYNAGEGKVDGWWQQATDRGETFSVATHIPFPETRAYVTKVLKARKAYRREYAVELGLAGL